MSRRCQETTAGLEIRRETQQESEADIKATENLRLRRLDGRASARDRGCNALQGTSLFAQPFPEILYRRP